MIQVSTRSSLRHLLITIAALSAGLPLGGCYSYVAAPLDSLTPGVQARFRLTPEGFGRVVNQAAMSGFSVDAIDLSRRSVAGRLMSLDGGGFTLQLRGPGAASFSADVPDVAVEEAARRQLSTGKTIGAAAAAAIAGFLVLGGEVGGSTGPPDPPEPEQSILSLISIPFSFPWMR